MLGPEVVGAASGSHILGRFCTAPSPGFWDIQLHSRVQALNMARRRREEVAGASSLTRVEQGTEIKREGQGSETLHPRGSSVQDRWD